MFKTIDDIMYITDGNNPFRQGLIYGTGGLGYKPTLYNMVGGAVSDDIFKFENYSTDEEDNEGFDISFLEDKIKRMENMDLTSEQRNSLEDRKEVLKNVQYINKIKELYNFENIETLDDYLDDEEEEKELEDYKVVYDYLIKKSVLTPQEKKLLEFIKSKLSKSSITGGTIIDNQYVRLDTSELDKLTEEELRKTLDQNYNFLKLAENDPENWIKEEIAKETKYIENKLDLIERRELINEMSNIDLINQDKADEFREMKNKEKEEKNKRLIFDKLKVPYEVMKEKEKEAIGHYESKLKEKGFKGLEENVDYQQNAILNEVDRLSKRYKTLQNPDKSEPIYIGDEIDEKIHLETDLINYLSNKNNPDYYNTKNADAPYYTSFVKTELKHKKAYNGKPILEYMLSDAIGQDNVIEHKYRDKTYNEWKNQGFILINKEKIEGNNSFIPYYKKDNNNNILLDNIHYIEKKPKSWENGKPKDFIITKNEKTLNNDNNDYNWIFTTKTRELSYNPLKSNKMIFYEENKPNIELTRDQLVVGKKYRAKMNLALIYGREYKIPFNEMKKNIK